MKIILTILLLLMLAITSSSNELIPPDNFVQGWLKFDKMLTFKKNALDGHIDGGAELFYEFGFEDLVVQRYKKDNTEIALELYRMESPESALGIYLNKCTTETPLKEVHARNTGDAFQLVILKGCYYIQINNFDGNEKIVPVMIALANLVINKIPAERKITLLQNLPREDLIKGTELLIRGPYSLQKIFTFGEGDVLQLNRTIFGVAGDYKDKKGKTYTLIVISYPDSNAARSAYGNLLAHLDLYIKIIDKKDNSFRFKDFQNKSGSVELKEKIITLIVGLQP
ncbi:MAG: hypothetical protein A2Y62_20305 [Candidatus Fischerbacteria bacterium RBG_13_37_8]|uniref:Uncharacterized protein n=1 Tax=Candidatus Fischerbacteria bacterium RBG_13_37_8 TaxID=1817863 RepID=A0A1F5VVM0_9BACT|nr:MAG: hypothetical protein A2Y62_20305 [Candidatus Fischerbacteria bacterium RBG_13_37_8]